MLRFTKALFSSREGLRCPTLKVLRSPLEYLPHGHTVVGFSLCLEATSDFAQTSIASGDWDERQFLFSHTACPDFFIFPLNLLTNSVIPPLAHCSSRISRLAVRSQLALPLFFPLVFSAGSSNSLGPFSIFFSITGNTHAKFSANTEKVSHILQLPVTYFH